jgi:hypothetical protein
MMSAMLHHRASIGLPPLHNIRHHVIPDGHGWQLA